MNFTKKGFGRIFVNDVRDIERVKEIIQEIDEFEYGYLPSNFIAPFSKYPNLEYVHKFNDININELTARCWKEDIFIFCVDNGMREFI